KRVPMYPQYVTVKTAKTFTPDSYNLYKLIGITEVEVENKKKKKTITKYVPIYTIVQKKGMKYKTGTVTEYGRESILPFNTIPEHHTIEHILDGDIREVINRESSGSPSDIKAFTDILDDMVSVNEFYGTQNAMEEMTLDEWSDWMESLDALQEDDIEINWDEAIAETPGLREKAEEWSSKEGWSTDYFLRKIWPNRDDYFQVEFELAENQEGPFGFSGVMSMDYEGNQRDDFMEFSSPLNAIVAGRSKATSIDVNQGATSKWKNVKEGDIIRFHYGTTAETRYVNVRVTKPFSRISDGMSLLEATETNAPIIQAEPIITKTAIPGEPIIDKMDFDANNEDVKQGQYNPLGTPSPSGFIIHAGGVLGADTAWGECFGLKPVALTSSLVNSLGLNPANITGNVPSDAPKASFVYQPSLVEDHVSS
ncbi:MAG: hypothetical protein EZS28_044357, partial [Streblomastix strix]